MMLKIQKHTVKDSFSLYADDSKWFKDNGAWEKEFKISIEDGVMYIEKLPLNYNGQTHKYSQLKDKLRFYFRSEDLKVGNYEIVNEDDCLKIEL